MNSSKAINQVAVIGAGIAGLACARELQSHGLSVDVFEKSRGPSGRMSTRKNGLLIMVPSTLLLETHDLSRKYRAGYRLALLRSGSPNSKFTKPRHGVKVTHKIFAMLVLLLCIHQVSILLRVSPFNTREPFPS